MCTRQECIERITQAAPFIRKEFEVSNLCVFGSMARGDNHPGSDVDVCVEMPPKALKVVALKSYLQNLLGTAVDVVRRSPHLDQFLANEIKRDGINIL
jgi:hypothetical protein